jgi:hypothetical protein
MVTKKFVSNVDEMANIKYEMANIKSHCFFVSLLSKISSSESSSAKMIEY